jgi:hypothetical protein
MSQVAEFRVLDAVGVAMAFEVDTNNVSAHATLRL